MQDFATAVQYDLPMTIFVMNNKQLSFIKYEQQAAGELEYAIDFSDMDHAKFAAGGKGYVLKDPSRIDEVVEAALNENVPTIVDVHVDPNPHHYQVKLLMKKQSTMVNGLTDQSLKIKIRLRRNSTNFCR